MQGTSHVIEQKTWACSWFFFSFSFIALSFFFFSYTTIKQVNKEIRNTWLEIQNYTKSYHSGVIKATNLFKLFKVIPRIPKSLFDQKKYYESFFFWGGGAQQKCLNTQRHEKRIINSNDQSTETNFSPLGTSYYVTYTYLYNLA